MEKEWGENHFFVCQRCWKQLNLHNSFLVPEIRNTEFNYEAVLQCLSEHEDLKIDLTDLDNSLSEWVKVDYQQGETSYHHTLHLPLPHNPTPSTTSTTSTSTTTNTNINTPVIPSSINSSITGGTTSSINMSFLNSNVNGSFAFSPPTATPPNPSASSTNPTSPSTTSAPNSTTTTPTATTPTTTPPISTSSLPSNPSISPSTVKYTTSKNVPRPRPPHLKDNPLFYHSKSVAISRNTTSFQTTPLSSCTYSNGIPVASQPTLATNAELLNRNIGRLWRETSERLHIDFPLCAECAKFLQDELQQEIVRADKDIMLFLSQPSCVDWEDDVSEEDLSMLREEIRELEREKEELVSSSSDLHNVRNLLKEQLKVLNEAKTKMDNIEQEYWINHSHHCVQRELFNTENRSLMGRLNYSNARLDKVRETYVLNDAFHIWYNGHFGTINGHRLGRLQSQSVDWQDINAAWGMTAMLLFNLAKQLPYEFENISIIPMGSQSKIEILKEKTQYELYWDAPIFLFSHKYDRAMQGILECTAQLINHIKQLDPTFNPPYEIEGDKINGASVKAQLNPEWTKALKYLLSNLKFLVAWVSLHRKNVINY